MFALIHNDLERILLVLGCLWILIAGAAMVPSVLRIRTIKVLPEAKALLKYGIQRVPGDFTLMALFTLPVTVIAHFEGVQQAGYVAFAISAMSMICAVFQPVGLVLLPKATYMFAEGSHRELRLHVSRLLKMSLLVSGSLTLFVYMFAAPLIRLYLGNGYEQVAGMVRLVVIGSLPYSIYLVLRNVIDAFHKNGVTAVILLISLAVFCGAVVTSMFRGLTTPPVVPAFLLALGTMAVASGLECRRIFVNSGER